MAAIKVFCRDESPRLQFVLDWVLTEVMHISYEIVDNEAHAKELPFYISYGESAANALSVYDAGLLWEEGIKEQNPSTGKWKDLPTFFHGENNLTIPFDIFSAIFFLITRYEEYYDYPPDKYGRYPQTASILHKNNLLLRPVVDEWIYQFYLLLKENNIPVHLTPFHYLPTYDIDMAYSYKHKGMLRNIGGYAKSLLRIDFSEAKRRRQTLYGGLKDPFDSFDFIKQLHTDHELNPIYFILSASKTTAFDKNIPLRHDAMQELINELQKDGEIALHPSYFSDDDYIFKEEKATLETITGTIISSSRQHYLRMKLPDTYYHLIHQNILQDYSMGYGAAVGFRAGTGRSFYWYDLKNEKPTLLKIHPFCFMDTAAHFGEKLSTEDAFAILNDLKNIMQETESVLMTVFHNFSLGTDEEWKGWGAAYELMMGTITQKEISTSEVL